MNFVKVFLLCLFAMLGGLAVLYYTDMLDLKIPGDSENIVVTGSDEGNNLTGDILSGETLDEDNFTGTLITGNIQTGDDSLSSGLVVTGSAVVTGQNNSGVIINTTTGSQCLSPFVGESVLMENGWSGIGYYQKSVPLSGNCESTEYSMHLKCTNGTIQPLGNGKKLRKTCIEIDYKSCTDPWGGTLAHGESITAFQSSLASSCQSEKRVCNNGTLKGSFTNKTCEASPALDCTAPWGELVKNGQSVQAYQNEIAKDGTSCNMETRVCKNGVLGGSSIYKTCSPEAKDCTFNGGVVKHGQTITKFQSSQVTAPDQCQSYNAKCTNGTLQGTLLGHMDAIYAQCTVIAQ